MFSAVQQDDRYLLYFKYDPNLINIVKQVPGREYHSEGKYWSIPVSHLGWLMKGIQGTAYEKSLQIISNEHINEDASLDSTKKIPDIDISDVDRYVQKGYQLFEHQLDFLKFAKAKGQKGFILADEMGCITGDAKIILRVNKSRAELSFEKLYERFHKLNPKGRYGKNTVLYAKCYDIVNDTTTYEEIIDVIKSGIKMVYVLELENGYKLRGTEDHPVYTNKGYIPLAQLTTEHEVFILGRCVYPVRVKCVTKLGKEMTYDLKLIGPHHNFFANRILVHNCGKTLETINYALYQRKRYRYNHCLIIACVNSAKYSWLEDIKKHTNGLEQGYILGSRMIKRGKRKGMINYNGSGQDKVDDLITGRMYGDPDADKLPYFLITNIEALGRTKSAPKKKVRGNRYILEEALIQMINNGTLSIIAIDECHKNMSPTSQQGKVILDMKKQTGKMVQWIPITGTPIRNKPLDVFTPLKLVDGHEIKSFFQWSHLFCIYGGYGGYEIMGYKNIPMLKDMLQGNMIRRKSSEVLDLPPIIYYNDYVDLTPCQAKLYEAINEEILSQETEILSSLNPLVAFLKLRQVTGSPELVDDTIKIDDKYLSKNAKLVRLLELIDDAVECGEKVIVFSNWVEPLRTIYKFISKKHKTCCYTGTMKEADREKHKQVFMYNPDYKVIIGTADAMGVSITLTAATNVIFYDDVWTQADKDQCIKRANRIGSTVPLKVHTLMAKDTIDERVRDILDTKKGISDFLVDNKLDFKANPKLFAYLLGKGD